MTGFVTKVGDIIRNNVFVTFEGRQQGEAIAGPCAGKMDLNHNRNLMWLGLH